MDEQKNEMEVQETTAAEPAVNGGKPLYDGASGGNFGGGYGGGYDPEEDALLPEGWTGTPAHPETDEDPLGLGPEDTDPVGFGETPEDTEADAAPPEPPTEPAETPEPAGKQETGEQDAGTQDAEPDYKALYQAEMDRQNAEKYRARDRELTEREGIPPSVAELAAAQEFGKRYPLEAADSGADAGTGADGGGESGNGIGRPDFASEMKQLITLYPDLREMPAEVMAAYGRGKSLTAAYSGFRARRDADTIADLRAKLDAANQRLANISRAPVTGVSAGGAKQEPEDPFLSGFNEQY